MVRKRKLTVFGVVEGDREAIFIDLLRHVYQPQNNNIAFYPENAEGGTPDGIVLAAIRKSDRDRSFAWLDEDFEPEYPLGEEVRQALAKCWNVQESSLQAFMECPLDALQASFNPQNGKRPTLIISRPVCADSIIIRVLGHSLPHPVYDFSQRKKQISDCKNKLNGIIGRTDELEFYKSMLEKQKLEALRLQIPELDMLIRMITS
jgi:hypothetical protein